METKEIKIQAAEAYLALIKLHQLRDYYRQG